MAWHLYLVAQPAGIVEARIEATAETFLSSFICGWTANPSAIPPVYLAEYLRASREAVKSIAAGYRASAGIDVLQDQEDRPAGRTLTMPVTVIPTGQGAALG
ncbi:hypothetical protein ACIQC5_24215 [Paenarthrobacter sp. NPDC092416]|uniref:hypothetical protein n=1 Tax=Paenarthrobacter sp. NPDC092416 TaxID=3364386 RepID=UPI00382F7287